MENIYAELIRKGLKTIEQVPTEIQHAVMQKLIEIGVPEHHTQEEHI